jgi:hypothetical protein
MLDPEPKGYSCLSTGANMTFDSFLPLEKVLRELVEQMMASN